VNLSRGELKPGEDENLIFGIGIDLIEVARFEKNFSKDEGQSSLISKLFTENEIRYCEGHRFKALNYAARFAAKEALLKALGTGLREGFNWQEIEVVNDELGKPDLVAAGKVKEFLAANGVKFIHLSLSHLKEIAAAFVVLEK